MLTPDLEVAREFVAANPRLGRILLCAVSGAHMYGFPSADSDLDLKGIHLAPTRELLGLRPDVAVHDLTDIPSGVECDLTTNEAGSALSLLLNGNGNMLERILSPFSSYRPTRCSSYRSSLADRCPARSFATTQASFVDASVSTNARPRPKRCCTATGWRSPESICSAPGCSNRI